MAAAVRPALLSAAQFHLRGHQLLAHHLEPVPYGAREAVLAPLHATLTVANGQPVSPALRCVVTLTVFFFQRLPCCCGSPTRQDCGPQGQ